MSLKLSGSAPVSALAARKPRFSSSRASASKVRKSVKGIVSVEIALLAIGLLGGMHMLFFTGRLAEARGRVQDIASEAARVASHAQDGTDAQKRVAGFLNSSKTNGGAASDTAKACSKPQATVDVSAFGRGGSVGVTIRCSVLLSDLAFVRIPGSFTLEASAAEVIDVLRSGS